MNEAKRMENKKEDKKVFKKFLMLLLVSGLIGGVCGFLVGFLGEDMNFPELFADMVYLGVTTISPFVPLVYAIVMGIALVMIYGKARRMASAWDGENEEEYERIDHMLENLLTATNIGMCINYFFFAVSFEIIVSVGIVLDIIILVGFVASMVVIIVGQQKIINLVKELNPEKKGSVYDTKFTDKWEESCDEAERILIYKSAYKAYSKMNIVFVGLWLFCIFGNDIWHFGLMPVTIVMGLWLTQICLYTYYTKLYSKHPEKIGVFR